MSKSDKPQWVARKYMGDCRNSWAIIDKRYLPKGHRGVIMEWLPDCAVSYTGLNSQNKAYYLRMKKAEAKEQSR